MDTQLEMPVRQICKPEKAASEKQFETLCLFHFFDVFPGGEYHGQGDIDLDAPRDFTKRQGVLREHETLKDYEAVKFNGHAKLIIELNETLRINQMRKENNSLIIEQRQKLEESEDLTHRVWAETNKMGFNIPSWVAYFPGFDELPSTKKTRGT